MAISLIWIPLGLAVVDWIAVVKNWDRVKYFSKPVVILALLVWLWFYTGFVGSLVIFALGLVFSLAGDIFLLLPARYFMYGLVSFLFAHLAYIAAFNANGLPPLLPTIFWFLIFSAVGAFSYHRLARVLKKRRVGKLRIMILVYTIIISLMVLSAVLTFSRPDWSTGPAVLAAGGGMLFFISDNILAWNRFISPLLRGKIMVRITYHLGQIALILGAALNFTYS